MVQMTTQLNTSADKILTPECMAKMPVFMERESILPEMQSTVIATLEEALQDGQCSMQRC